MDNKYDLYWLAGFLEGEGYFGLRRGGKDLVIQVGGVDRDVIEKAQRIMGCRTIKPRQLKSGKTFFHLTLCAQAEAAQLMEALLPLMGERRADVIRSALKARSTVPPAKKHWTHCKNGHPLAGPNLRIVTDGKYQKRRCRECGRLRQRKHRAGLAA